MTISEESILSGEVWKRPGSKAEMKKAFRETLRPLKSLKTAKSRRFWTQGFQ
jgi:hypothetical protein